MSPPGSLIFRCRETVVPHVIPPCFLSPSFTSSRQVLSRMPCPGDGFWRACRRIQSTLTERPESCKYIGVGEGIWGKSANNPNLVATILGGIVMYPKSRTSFLAVLVLALFLILAIGIPSSLAAAPADKFAKGSGGGKLSMPSYKPGEVLVTWKDGASANKRGDVKVSVGAVDVLMTTGQKGKDNTQLLKLKPDVSVEEAIKAFRSRPEVESADPNYLRRLSYTPSSPDFPNQWGLNNTGQTIQGQAGTPGSDIDATKAWDIERGSSNETTIAVIDSGMDLTHPNLSGRLWTNPGEIPNNGVDDDGNGYVDDVHGYNWAGISNYYMSNYYDFGTTYTPSVAQSFVARAATGDTCPVRGAEVALHGYTGSPTSNIVVSLRSSLGGANITSYTLTPAEISSSLDTYYKNFTTPQNLTNGSTYYLVMTMSVPNNNNYYYYVDHTYNGDYDTYVEGSEWCNYGGGWTNYSTDDLYFRTSAYYYNRDNNGHGTHCCGIAADADSGAGSVGVAPGSKTKLMALKAGDASGSLSVADEIAAINYASNMGANIISLSLI